MDSTLPVRSPMSAGDIIDRAFQLYAQNAGLFIGTLAVLLVPQAILTFILPIFGIVTIVTTPWAFAALMLVVSARLHDQHLSIGEAYSSVGVNTVVAMIVTSIIYGVVVSIGLVLLIVPGIYMAVRWAFYEPAIVLERRGILDSLSRSSELVRGNWWRVFGIALLVLIVIVVASGVLGGLLGAVFSAHVANLLGSLIGLVVDPFAVAALILLYYDERLRHEGNATTSVESFSSF